MCVLLRFSAGCRQLVRSWWSRLSPGTQGAAGLSGKSFPAPAWAGLLVCWEEHQMSVLKAVRGCFSPNFQGEVGCVLLYLLFATWVDVSLALRSASLSPLLLKCLGLRCVTQCHLPARQRCRVCCPGLWWELPPQAESGQRGEFVIP